MGLSLAEELVLLAYRDDGTLDVGHLEIGVAAASLLELAVAGRIAIDGDAVVVVDPAPTGHPTADAALERIAAAPRTPRELLTTHRVQTGEAVLTALVDAGVLERVTDRVLLVFPRTRYPAPDGVEPVAETDARRRMADAIEGVADARTAALCTLIGVLGWDRLVFPDVPAVRLQERLAELRREPWATPLVAEVEAAVLTAAVLPAVIT